MGHHRWFCNQLPPFFPVLHCLRSIPGCCLPTSSSVCLVFFTRSLCLARWFWPDLMNRRHDHTTSVCISLRWSGGLRVVWLPAGSWHGLPRWLHGLCMRCVVSCSSTSFPWLVFFFGALLWGSMIHETKVSKIKIKTGEFWNKVLDFSVKGKVRHLTVFCTTRPTDFHTCFCKYHVIFKQNPEHFAVSTGRQKVRSEQLPVNKKQPPYLGPLYSFSL